MFWGGGKEIGPKFSSESLPAQKFFGSAVSQKQKFCGFGLRLLCSPDGFRRRQKKVGLVFFFWRETRIPIFFFVLKHSTTCCIMGVRPKS